MRLKSYHSASVESAIRLAHIELGDEAVFLGARRNDVGSDPAQAYEVSFAVMDRAEAAMPAAPPQNREPQGREPQGREPDGRQTRAAAESAERPRVNGRAPQPRAAVVSPPRGTSAAADAGALVSWKQFLRQVGRRGSDAAGDPDRAGGDAGGAARESAATAPASFNSAAPGSSAAAAGSNGTAPGSKGAAPGQAVRGAPPRAYGLPHWKEFVPGGAAGRETGFPAGLFGEGDGTLPEEGAAEQGALPPAETRPLAETAPRSGNPAVIETSPRSVSPAVTEIPPRAASRDVTAIPARTAPPAGAPGTPSSPKNGSALPDAAPQGEQRAAGGQRGAAHPGQATPPQAYSLEQLGQELEQLRHMFERQQQTRTPPAPQRLSDPRLARFYHSLLDNGIESALAMELLATLREAAGQGAEQTRLAALLARAIRNRFAANSELGCAGAARAVAALVGPAGAGKTTAVAKLAFRCGLLRRRRVRLFSVDQLRIGAVEPLQAYAELMNTPLQVVDEFDKLGAALGAPGSESERELLLIDTPGYGRREWDRARRTAAALAAVGDIDVHLVLDLRTKTDDLRRAIEAFGVFRPAKLLFSRLDETATFGTMLNETVRTGLPVSFVSVGQRVPEDIVPAGEPELLRLLLRDRSSA